MKVLGFVGSARKSGNTSRLVQEVLAGADSEGAETKLYQLSELNMQGCQGCLYCREHGKCVINDDLQPIYDELKAAEALVIGSPIYIHQLSGQTKLLLDRFYPLTDQNHNPRFGEKKLVMAYTQAAPLRLFFWRYRRYVKKSLTDMGLIHRKDLVATKCFAQNTVANNGNLLAKAYATGCSLTKDPGLLDKIKAKLSL